MREVKFRAWDTDTEEYVETGLKLFEVAGVVNRYFNADIDLSHLRFEQYTGVKDLKGVEIYEGDIIRSFTPKKTKTGYDVEDIRVVEWEEFQDYESGDFLGVGFNVHESMFKNRLYNLSPFQIIGNINEDPNLL